MLASIRPAAFEVDLADLVEWFAQVRMALLGHSTSRHNHQYHSNSFGAPRDHRIPCAERYGHETRCRHRREVVGCPGLSCDPTDIELWHCAKAAREIDFIARLPLNPGPAEALSAAGEGQMDPICFGFCRTYAHEPAFMCNGTGSDKHANDRRH